jgi:hypothetical protein
MKKIYFLIWCWFAALGLNGQNVEWKNGLWFNGKNFQSKKFYSVNGLLTQKRPDKVDQIVDLKNKYVIPALGDAHHHGIDGVEKLDSKIEEFLKAGIFYVKNPNVIPDLLTAEVRKRINNPSSIDVTFSNGGLTASGAHPVGLHEFLSKKGVFPGLAPSDMENKAYFIIDSEKDLIEKWPMIQAGNPDFIKTFLTFSEELQKPVEARGKYKSLDPTILKKVVEVAHKYNLTVTSHIETATDFRNAVFAGVDEINHLPQPRKKYSPDFSAYVIDETTAETAAKNKLTVVATASIGPKNDTLPEKIANQRNNLQLLYRKRVTIVMGSDGISGEEPIVTAQKEAMYFHHFRFFDNLTLLKMWSENTPKAIFPNRKIGKLAEGYEANFLVLEGDPIDKFENIKNISMRIKAGQEIKMK